MMTFNMKAVGQIQGGRKLAEDDHWGATRARIELDPALFTPEALIGLSDFSHVEVVFVFDRFLEDEITYGARHPRGNIDWPKVGIFAQRGKFRPNRIGASICRVCRVEDFAVEVEGLDAIDGTPVLDIKPVMAGFLPRGEFREPSWARELMRHYW